MPLLSMLANRRLLFADTGPGVCQMSVQIEKWAKDEKIAYKTINAPVETVDTARSYRQAFKKRRCLIPVDGFYEWRKVLRRQLAHGPAAPDRFIAKPRRPELGRCSVWACKVRWFT